MYEYQEEGDRTLLLLTQRFEKKFWYEPEIWNKDRTQHRFT